MAAGEQLLGAVVGVEQQGAAVGQAQRRLERLGKPLARLRPHLQAVDHHVDRVLLGARQLRQIVHLDDRAVDPQADEALGLQVGEQLGELALAAAHQRRQHDHARLGRQRQRRVDHLRHALRRQRLLRMVRAVRRAGARKQQAQVVVDLGDGADRRAGVVQPGPLLDRDGRAEAFDQVDVRLLHQLQELPRVGRQRLDVAALSLRVQRVEGERALARAGQPGDDDQPAARQVQVDVLQVVRSGAADAQTVHRADVARRATCYYSHALAAHANAPVRSRLVRPARPAGSRPSR